MNAEIIHGDCLDVMSRMPTASVDAIITDPPYLNTGKASSRVSTSAAIPSERQFFDLWMREMWRTFARVLKPTGALFLTIDWRGALSCEMAEGGTDLTFGGVGIWHRGGLGMGYMIRHVYECFVVARKPDWKRALTDEPDLWRHDWYPSIRKTDHEAEKPEALIERAIRLLSPPPCGVILDPFFGSGTTGVVGERLGYRVIGVEREATFIEDAQRRLSDARSQTTLGVA